MSSYTSIFLLLVGTVCSGGRHSRAEDDGRFAVRNVDPTLRGKAAAVIRLREITFEAREDGSGTMRFTRAVTVYSEAGKGWGDLYVFYDRVFHLEEFDGWILDAGGEEVRELESSDIRDISAWSGADLTTDTRVRYASLAHNVYPYTILFSYEIERTSGIQWPSWEARVSDDPVEHTRFEVRHPASIPLRYHVNQDTLTPARSRDGSDSVFVWEARNVPGLPDDGAFEDIEFVSPRVLIAPSRFDVEGRQGDMSSWSSFGQWYAQLARGKDVLPPDAVADVRRLTETVTDTKERARLLYQYLQERTRYISIQLGIGGFQPFDASFVHSRRYGDCKALSNYMVSLLRVAGVKAHQVLIRNGYYIQPTVTSFPSQQFNHVIVCVPTTADTVWMECTSQSIPFGVLGDANEGRPALLIDSTGGTLITTPMTGPDENTQTRVATATLDVTGALRLESRSEQRGNQQNAIRATWAQSSPENRIREYLSEHGISEAKVRSFSAKGVEERQEEATVSLTADLSVYASRTGDRMFVPVDPFTRHMRPPMKAAKRLAPRKIYFGYRDIDTVRITLPKGFVVEAVPKPARLSSSFAAYELTVTEEAPGIVCVVRTIEVRSTIIQVEDYPGYISFYTDKSRSDRAQIVLRRTS